jgi:RNA polymerase sigma-70 factor (ECF subfamily)
VGSLPSKPDWKNSSSSTHENGSLKRHAEGAVLDVGGLADRAIADSALALATDWTSGSMTLSERVQALFEQLHVPVFRYLLRKTRDSGQAEDITQETFLRLFKHLREDRLLDNPKAWLFTVAKNLAIYAIRNENHVKDLDEDTWKKIEESRSGLGADPEKLTLQHERVDRLQIAVLNLTPLQRECLHLRAEGLRYREIAGLMELSLSTVMDAVRRATLKLAGEFGGEAAA